MVQRDEIPVVGEKRTKKRKLYISIEAYMLDICPRQFHTLRPGGLACSATRVSQHSTSPGTNY